MFEKLNQKNIFLFDGIGALASALLTGLILPVFSQELGLPKDVLQSLASFPVIYAFYSFICFWFLKQPPLWMLAAIMAANLCYCFVSAAVVFSVPEITKWGRAFLIAEVFVILAVVAIEWTVYRRGSKKLF